MADKRTPSTMPTPRYIFSPFIKTPLTDNRESLSVKIRREPKQGAGSKSQGPKHPKSAKQKIIL
jgi:hypothetical protein